MVHESYLSIDGVNSFPATSQIVDSIDLEAVFRIG